MTRNLTPSQSLYVQTRRSILAAMETGNVDHARTVLKEYQAHVRESLELIDMAEDLRTDVVASYGVSL